MELGGRISDRCDAAISDAGPRYLSGLNAEGARILYHTRGCLSHLLGVGYRS